MKIICLDHLLLSHIQFGPGFLRVLSVSSSFANGIGSGLQLKGLFKMLFSPIFSGIKAAKLQNPLKIRAWLEQLLYHYDLEVSTPLASYIYTQGVRPEYRGIDLELINQPTLMAWFSSRLTLDIYTLARAAEPDYERFLDLLDLQSAQTLLQLGQIAAKYNLFPLDYTPNNLSRINDTADRRDFEKNFLEEAVLSSAFQVLAGVFYYVHGKLYPIKT